MGDAGLDRKKRTAILNEDENALSTWEEVGRRRRPVYHKIKGRLRRSKLPSIVILNARNLGAIAALPILLPFFHFVPFSSDLSAVRHHDIPGLPLCLRIGD